MSPSGSKPPARHSLIIATLSALVLSLVIGFQHAHAGGAIATLVKDINPGAGDGFGTQNAIIDVDGTAFFGGLFGGQNGLWKSDGTEAGTVLVKAVSMSGLPGKITSVGGTVFFTANDGIHGEELWKSDGTEAGTVMVKDVRPFCAACVGPELLTNVGGTLFFTADDGTLGRELWKSDGTEAGTVMVKDINPGADQSNPLLLVDLEGVLYFSALDGVGEANHGRELWRSDGTPEGTVLVKDILPGPASAFPSPLVEVGGTLLFGANDGVSGTELWESDGTESGTTLVKDVNAGAAGSSPQNLVNVDGTLFFSASVGVWGREVWRSDGTEEGTTLVKDIRTGSTGSTPNNLVNVNGTLFLAANDGVSGQELWRSDGTETGTQRVKDVRPGPTGGVPADLTAVHGSVFFRADDGSSGPELWQSDGTEAGTALVEDINPGTASSNPRSLTQVGAALFFTAIDGIHGRELWKAEANQPPQIEPIADQVVDELVVLEVSPVVTDPEGDPFTLTWEGLPDGAQTDGGTFSWTPSEAQGPGDYLVTVTATQDSDPSLVDAETFLITVAEVNAPPILDPIGDQTVPFGEPVEFTATASDPDIPANTLTFSLEPILGSLDGAVIDPDSGAFFCECATGEHIVKIVVSDGDLSDDETITITVGGATEPSADLEVAIGAEPDPVAPQSSLVYEVVVSNHGPSDASGVVLSVRLPGGVSFGSVTPNTEICSAKGRNATCEIGTLAADGSFTAEISIGTKGGSTLTAEATVTANEDDPDPANNTDAATVGVCRRDCP